MNKKMIYLTIGFIAIISTLTIVYAIASFTYTANLTVPKGNNLVIYDSEMEVLKDGVDVSHTFVWNNDLERFEFDLILENVGSKPITATIQFDDFPEDWVFTSEPEDVPVISAGENEEFTLIIVPPVDYVVGDSTGEWSFTITEAVAS